MQFRPATYEELAELVKDERVHLGDIDTSAITNMRWLFCDSKRKDFSGIECWDTSNIKNMVGMFRNAIYFNADISGWDTSKVWNMDYCLALPSDSISLSASGILLVLR